MKLEKIDTGIASKGYSSLTLLESGTVFNSLGISFFMFIPQLSPENVNKSLPIYFFFYFPLAFLHFTHEHTGQINGNSNTALRDNISQTHTHTQTHILLLSSPQFKINIYKGTNMNQFTLIKQ